MFKGEINLFQRIFNVFSRRQEFKLDPNLKPIPEAFRNRIVMLFRDEFQISFNNFLAELHQKVSYLHGKFRLDETISNSSVSEDMFNYLITCKDEHFLDILELIFRSNLSGISYPDNPLITSINEFLRIDNLPYHLTGYVTETYSEKDSFGSPTTGIRLTEFPKIIRRDNDIMHNNVMMPTLNLLSSEEYKNANKEFLNALEDFRKHDFRDCLTKCCSTFESVMKVICNKNKIPFKNTDTASVLLKTLLEKSQLDNYWEQPLMIIATLRNRLSSSHGAGVEEKVIKEHVAEYIINATASAILLLNGEFK